MNVPKYKIGSLLMRQTIGSPEFLILIHRVGNGYYEIKHEYFTLDPFKYTFYNIENHWILYTDSMAEE